MHHQHSSIRSRPSHQRHEDDVATKFVLEDVLTVMIKQERTVYLCHDYLEASRCRAVHDDRKITPEDRKKIIDWCYDIVDQCGFDRLTVAVAMNIMDRFACAVTKSRSPSRGILYDRAQYQLASLTALYISIKLYERVAFSSLDFSVASQGVYTTEDIELMEREMLHGLEWRLSIPTPLHFGYQILDLMAEDTRKRQTRRRRGAKAPREEAARSLVPVSTFDFLRDELAYQTENAVRSYSLSTLNRQSTVAIVSILNAFEKISDADYQVLMAALMKIIRKFNFEHPKVLLQARDELRALMEDNEEDVLANESDDDVSIDSTNTQEPSGVDAQQNLASLQQSNRHQHRSEGSSRPFNDSVTSRCYSVAFTEPEEEDSSAAA
jgi:hypothetical protein